MDVGTLLSVAQTLFAALQCSQLKEMCSFLGYQSELQDLKATVATINAVLKDAEAKRELSHEAQCYIEELKDAVYDADDLIDEFVTRAESKYKKLAEGRNVSEKEVRQRLDAIASNHNRFGFKLDSEPIRKRREETCSYVYEQDIIGREDDKEKIVGMLLDPNVQRDVSFLTIVGIGGLGKTTLAQLVYNDERVTKHFDLSLWACVSDEDSKHLDIKAIISKILGSTRAHNLDGSSMEWLQGQLRRRLSGKKYMLVLDDVWNENRDEWLKLEKFLVGCLWGSWVVVTTRSKETAKVVSDGSEYELEGLSEENSWRLFERIAFKQGEGRVTSLDLIKTGKGIVKKCANVPLAIRVVGSLLYGQGKNKWQSFQEIGLGEIRKDENGISHILMLSYHNLESRLKSCFSYCAIFPKDFELKKGMLINLWMAQGYIVPLDEGQSVEDAAEEYFSILLRRCFFQDVEKDEHTGEILSCKMHDLMHDIAQKVAGKEVCVVNSITSNLDRKTRHISYAQTEKYTKGGGHFTSKIGIRTHLLCYSSIELPLGALLANWMCLRVLDLHASRIKSLPDTIGRLLHLRYLDLSNNHDLKALPKSITKLHNLQNLILSNCYGLIELPNDFSKLVKLRVLDTNDCFGLTHMPPGMGKLCCLQWLMMFVVGEASSKQGVVDQLEELKSLTHLKGCLRFQIKKIPENAAYVKRNSSDQGGYMRSKQHLKSIIFEWRNEESEGNEKYAEALLEDLQPHPNLRELDLRRYHGNRMPSWMKEGNFGTFFSNLVRIFFSDCHGLQHLPFLEKLPHLRVLEVRRLSKLEYMEDTRGNTSSCDKEASFFPSLEVLNLSELPELKGWWRDDDLSRQPRVLPSFPRLSLLEIRHCPELTRIPLCPVVEKLTMYYFNERLRVIEKKTGTDQERGPTTCSSNSLPSYSENWKLKEVTTDNVRGLKWALPMEAFHCLTQMTIGFNAEVESLEEVGEVFQSCRSSLHFLLIQFCVNLRSLSQSNDDDRNMPWRCLHHSLRALELRNLPKVVELPKGMQYLTSLQSLYIRECKSLESLPQWMPSLTSLTRLVVMYCSEELLRRCQSPDGEDWPHIQHIPYLVITQGGLASNSMGEFSICH